MTHLDMFDSNPARGRAIHLIDVENLLGTSFVMTSAVAYLQTRYLEVVGIAPGDHVVLATGRRAALATWLGWKGGRKLLRGGVDGADRALLEVIEHEALDRRFPRVVLASGDGIFAEACARLRAEGCSVTVVARPDSLSRQLRLAAQDIRRLPLAPGTVRLPYAPEEAA